MENKIKKYKIIEADYDDYLHFENNFNSDLELEDLDMISKFRKVCFGYSFNKPITNLPSNVEELHLSESYNQSVDNLCKPVINLCCVFNFLCTWNLKYYNLKILVISGKFNQSIDKLPDSIEHLILIGSFNQPINKLPNKLSYLKIVGPFNQPIKSFPKYLDKIIITNKDYEYSLNHLPEGISNIKVSSHYKYTKELSSNFPHSRIVFQL